MTRNGDSDALCADTPGQNRTKSKTHNILYAETPGQNRTKARTQIAMCTETPGRNEHQEISKMIRIPIVENKAFMSGKISEDRSTKVYSHTYNSRMKIDRI